MARTKKYYGMTGSQIGILGSLGILTCCLLGVLGWLVANGDGISLARPEPPTPTIISSPTMIVIPTATSTPAPTPIPYEQLIPAGWVQHKTALFEIWLPTGYKETKLDVSKLPEGFTPPALALSQGDIKSSLYIKWVLVSYEPLAKDSLDAQLDTWISEGSAISSYMRVVERKKVSLNGIEAIRFIIENRSTDNIEVAFLSYVFLDGTTIWTIQYATSITEFYTLLPAFEDSAKTFRITK